MEATIIAMKAFVISSATELIEKLAFEIPKASKSGFLLSCFMSSSSVSKKAWFAQSAAFFEIAQIVVFKNTTTQSPKQKPFMI